MSKDLPDVYTPTPRKSFTAKQRLKVFLEKGGQCCICGGQIDGSRETWILEHVTALADGGTNDPSNLALSHENCAKGKTSGEASTRKRHRKAAERHFGAKQKTGFRTNKSGPYKKLMDGTVVCRKTGKPIKG